MLVKPITATNNSSSSTHFIGNQFEIEVPGNSEVTADSPTALAAENAAALEAYAPALVVSIGEEYDNGEPPPAGDIEDVLDAKGDIIGASGESAPARIPAGTNGQVLTADSAAESGASFKDAAGGGDFSNGGEAGGAERSMGNTDNYPMSLKSNDKKTIRVNNEVAELLFGLIKSMVADGATAIALEVDTANALNTSGAKLLVLKNAGGDRLSVDKDGKLRISSGGSYYVEIYETSSFGYIYGKNHLTIGAGVSLNVQNSIKKGSSGINIGGNSGDGTWTVFRGGINLTTTDPGHAEFSGDHTIRIKAGARRAANVTYIAGDPVEIGGQDGASSSSGQADGGPVEVDGGAGYGTGEDGPVLIQTNQSGNVSISGPDDPDEKLVVGGNITPADDDTHDLGKITARWDDVYATNGTIQTSDQRLKRDIASMDVALAVNFLKLVRPVTFRWQDYDIPAQTKTVTRQKTHLVSKEIETEEIVFEDGKYVKKTRSETVEVEEPLFEEHPVYDENGDLIEGEIHQVPVMETVEVEVSPARSKAHTRKHCGLVAQEVEAVLTGMGVPTTDFAAFCYDQDADRYAVRYTELVPILVKGWQEQHAKIEELEARIATLESA